MSRGRPEPYTCSPGSTLHRSPVDGEITKRSHELEREIKETKS